MGVVSGRINACSGTDQDLPAGFHRSTTRPHADIFPTRNHCRDEISRVKSKMTICREKCRIGNPYLSVRQR